MATEETIRIIADTGNAIAGIEAVARAGAKMGVGLQGIGGTLVGLGAKVGLFTAPLALGLGAATKNAIDFDQAMSGASRALDLSGKEVEDFKRQALAIAPPLGLLPEKFAELATEAGKLGVAKKDIIDFAKVIAETAAITDSDAIKLSSSFAALQTITGASGKQLEIFGAAVNKLDDNVGGTTPDIIEFTRQTAATGKLLKLGIKDLAAYGSTMASLGIQNHVAYRSFNSLLNKLAASQTLSKKGQEAFKDLGLNAQQMARIMTTDANQGIEIFLTAIQKVAAVDTSRALGAVKQIVGGDYNDEILTLALSHQKLATALTYTSDAYDAANLQKKNDELAKKLGNVKGQTAVMQAQMQRLGITLGSAVLPNLNDLLGMMTPLIDKFAVFAETHPGIVKVGMAIAAVTLSISPLLIGAGAVISALGTIATILPAVSAAWAGFNAVAIAGTITLGAITAPAWAVVGVMVAIGAAVGATIAMWDRMPPFVQNATSQAKFYFGLLAKDVMDFPANVAQIPDAFSSIFSAIAAQFTYLSVTAKYHIAQIKYFFVSLGTDAYNSGISFINNFANGIKNSIGYVQSIVSNMTQSIRNYLPFSPAKEGALSDLDQSGIKLVQTVAQGINPDPIAIALNNALSSANLALSSDSGLFSNQAPGIQSPSFAMSNGGNQPIVINDNRTFNLGTSSTSNGNIDVIEVLKKSDRELLDLIEKAKSRWNRNR